MTSLLPVLFSLYNRPIISHPQSFRESSKGCVWLRVDGLVPSSRAFPNATRFCTRFARELRIAYAGKVGAHHLPAKLLTGFSASPVITAIKQMSSAYRDVDNEGVTALETNGVVSRPRPTHPPVLPPFFSLFLSAPRS